MRKTILVLVLMLASLITASTASAHVTRVPGRCSHKPASTLCAIHFHHGRASKLRVKMGLAPLPYRWIAEGHPAKRAKILSYWVGVHKHVKARYKSWKAQQHRSGNGAVTIGKKMAAARGWTGSQWLALYKLWNGESGWNPNAYNSSSGACGIPQAVPCSKISDHSVQGQVAWGLNYIAGRYGNPAAAWAHSQGYGWY